MTANCMRILTFPPGATGSSRAQPHDDEPDRYVQATMWQELNNEAAKNMWAIPFLFEKEQRLAGSKVGPLYISPPFGAWPYAAMYSIGR